MADEVKLSYHDYAAISFGDEAEGSWMFCQVAEAGKYFFNESFYGVVHPGDFQIKMLSPVRILNIVNTGQMILNARLAYFGQIPAALTGEHATIYEMLRAGTYFEWPGHVNNGV